MLLRIGALLFIVMSFNRLCAQSCTTLGQTPSTAFPVCGDLAFEQTTVPICGDHGLYVPGCSGDNSSYADKNPFWYRFTCYTSGTLGLLIIPKNLGDDYDWMLYDITGHSPDEVFTNNSLIVTGNWAGTYGLTGASNAGVNFIQCGSSPTDNKNTYSKMPNIIAGHQYLLLISHFTNSQSGYKLEFGGGTAVITDPKQPQMQNAWAGCGGVTVTIKLNKKMKCNSVAIDASDFMLSSNAATIVSAMALGCGNSFDMDTVVLSMSNALPPGDYTITAKNGSDGNTLLDNCNRNIPPGSTVNFTVLPVQPTPMDSLTPPGCIPDIIDLVFSKPIQCSSIAANGSDFIINGSTPVTVTNAYGDCVNGFTSKIHVKLSSVIQTAGAYTIRLVQGSDGNTIIDECGQQTPAGATLNFVTADTVNAGFSYQLLYGCTFDTVTCIHDGRNSVNEWNWNFNDQGNSSVQNPRFVFPTFGMKTIHLSVSNGVCRDSAEATVHLDNELDAAFAYPQVVCPEDMASFTDQSIGNIISWKWDFGDGDGSSQKDPAPKKYPLVTTGRTKFYTVRLIVENNLHCLDTVVHQVKTVNTCFIAVPNAFTPNNDFNNDYLYPLNAYKAVNLEFKVYNRYGQLVFQTTDWTRKWDGAINGRQQPTGVFVWTLRYTDGETGEKIFRKGATVLIR